MKRNVVSWAALGVAVLALIGARGYTSPLPAAQQIPAEGQQVAKALSSAFNAVAEKSAPSVVQINVEMGRRAARNGQRNPQMPQGEMPKELEDMLKKFFGGQVPNMERQGFGFQRQQFEGFGAPAEGTGSGFVYDDKGHILTNAHVVDGADKIVVSFNDGNELPAKVVGVNTESDVAVIQVDSTEYEALKLGSSSDLKVGQWVLALGSPFGLDHTVTAGIVSATERQNVGINKFESFIQTDAAINPGNSGGPLLDLEGHVVGINSAIATASRSNAGVGFAIPIDMATRIADKLIKDGKVSHALMGIGIDPVTPKLARQLGLAPKTKGLVVTTVGPGTPAEAAGLKVGDVLLSFDGKPVSSISGLQYLVSTSDLGKSYPVVYVRDGKEVTAQVTPAEASKFASLSGGRQGRTFEDEGRDQPAEARHAQGPAVDFGFEATPVNAELAKKYEWDEKADGLVVTRVVEDGPAAASGMEVGDRITKVIIDKKITPVSSVADLEKAFKGKDEVAVFVEDVRKALPGQFMTLSREAVEKK